MPDLTHVFVVAVEDSDDPLYVFTDERCAQLWKVHVEQMGGTATLSEEPLFNRERAATLTRG